MFNQEKCFALCSLNLTSLCLHSLISCPSQLHICRLETWPSPLTPLFPVTRDERFPPNVLLSSCHAPPRSCHSGPVARSFIPQGPLLALPWLGALPSTGRGLAACPAPHTPCSVPCPLPPRDQQPSSWRNPPPCPHSPPPKACGPPSARPSSGCTGCCGSGRKPCWRSWRRTRPAR